MAPIEITHGEIKRVKIVIVRWIAGLIVTIFGWSIYWAVKVTNYINAKDNFAVETRRVASDAATGVAELKTDVQGVKNVQYTMGIIQATHTAQIDNLKTALKN